MGASVLCIGPYLSPGLLLFLVQMQGLTWQWDWAFTGKESLGASCTWPSVQAPSPRHRSSLRTTGPALALQVWAHTMHQLLLCPADLPTVRAMGTAARGSQARPSQLQREIAVIHTSWLPATLLEHHACFKMQLFKPIQLLCEFPFKICKYARLLS